MNFFHLNSDILISLFSEWFDKYSLVDLDSALVNKDFRQVFLSILSRKECVLELNLSLKLVGSKNVLKWIENRSVCVKTED